MTVDITRARVSQRRVQSALATGGAAICSRLLILLIAASFIFFATAMLPGDFVSNFLGQDYTEATALAMRRDLGLDQPLFQRYLSWLSHAITGDFGRSFTTQTSVISIALPRMQNTAALSMMTIMIWFPASVILGVLVFLIGGWARRIFQTVNRLIMAVPEFILAYALIYVFAVTLHLAPATSRLSQNLSFFEQIRSFVLPTTALGVAMLAYVANQVDALLSTEQTKDYFEYACLRGHSRRHVVIFLALPEISASITSLFFIYLAHLITGVIVIETIFGFAGLGDLMISAVLSKDVPVVQFCAILITTVYIAAYSLADLWSSRGARRGVV